MYDKKYFSLFVDELTSGKRLDLYISSQLHVSRSYASNIIQQNYILVQGKNKKAGYRVKTGENITGFIPESEPVLLNPESIPLEILFEDRHIIVINKPPGLVVHPAPGHPSGTLVNALLYHFPEVTKSGIQTERPGIVHRLDKDTSGTMVIAKTSSAHQNLSLQFKQRKVSKRYIALVHGKVEPVSGVVSFSIGRHPIDRKKMSTNSRKSREAITTWKVVEYFDHATLLRLNIKTGRTHQIRVHCAAIGHPIVGDPLYCKSKLDKLLFDTITINLPDAENLLYRQMLHACCLDFKHPLYNINFHFQSVIPSDMHQLINYLGKK
ncbi:MAG: RluA family pseudouridine synthase [Desulfobacterales bacterium]|nr:RluA family pseudouridine synthase [Desulfobacterales bacterium]